MKWRHVKPLILHQLRFEDNPDVIVIHCGGNDLGEPKSVSLRFRIKSDLIDLKAKLTKTFLFGHKPCQGYIGEVKTPTVLWKKPKGV